MVEGKWGKVEFVACLTRPVLSEGRTSRSRKIAGTTLAPCASAVCEHSRSATTGLYFQYGKHYFTPVCRFSDKGCREWKLARKRSGTVAYQYCIIRRSNGRK